MSKPLKTIISVLVLVILKLVAQSLAADWGKSNFVAVALDLAAIGCLLAIIYNCWKE